MIDHGTKCQGIPCTCKASVEVMGPARLVEVTLHLDKKGTTPTVHDHHWVMTNSALIEGQGPTDLHYLCTTCKEQATHCHQCGRRKGCTAYCTDMDCDHCYCYREGRDG